MSPNPKTKKPPKQNEKKSLNRSLMTLPLVQKQRRAMLEMLRRIMKTIRAKDNVFHDVLDRVRTLVKKYSHSVKAELYELVQLLVVCYVVTRWWTDVDMMEKPHPYQQQEH